MKYKWDGGMEPIKIDNFPVFYRGKPITEQDIKKARVRRRNQMLTDFVYYAFYFILYCMVTAMFLSVLV